MIVLDTSVLIEALGAGGTRRAAFRDAISDGHRMLVPSLVLYEWRRGPRDPSEIALEKAVLPRESIVDFGHDEAVSAANLYRDLPRTRGREIDLAIAACALAWDAPLWTLNEADFRDVPGLRLYG
jgi:predicted nucleic acid-binding protein